MPLPSLETTSVSHPSTGSFYGFLFSIPGYLEGLGQVQRGVVQRETMDRRPEIQHVSLDSTIP